MRTPAVGETLTRAQLAAKTLRRQHLSAPTLGTIPDLVEQLAGLQAQTPWSWYFGIGYRMTRPDLSAASALLRDGALVRIVTMRSTIHLHTIRDALLFRATLNSVQDRALRANFGRFLADVRVDEITAAARDLLDEAALTNRELTDQLSLRWPTTPPRVLSMVARHTLPLVQVPPRGRLGMSGPIAHMTVSGWLGVDLPERGNPREVVRRYLRAFGPASIADFQRWSGMTGVAETFDELNEELVPYRSETGQQLYDLGVLAEEPSPDVSGVHFLYDYDNILLGYQDRSRFVTPEYTRRQFHRDPVTPQIILVDGQTAGVWRAELAGAAVTVTAETFGAGSRARNVEIEERARWTAQLLYPEHTFRYVAAAASRAELLS